MCNSNITYNNSFLTFGGSLTFSSHLTVLSLHCAVLTSHMSVLLSHYVVPLFFFLTFDNLILILCNSNITCDSSFLTLGDFLTFFSYLTVLSSHCAVPILHLTILLSYIIVPLFIYFLKFDGSIVILSSTNIASVLFLLHVTILLSRVRCDSSFITFGSSLTFFFQI